MEDRRRHHLGLVQLRPALNLVYYGTGNPEHLEPGQRPGDNKWSMTIFARDLDTGMAKWVYQMTPHDEWDYDGVNEMILADIKVKGKPRKALVHFDRNGFAYTLDRMTGELLVAEKYDPKVNWATHVDMKTGRPQVVAQVQHGKNGPTSTPRASARRRSAPRTSSRRLSIAKTGCSMCRPTTCAWTTNRSRSSTPPASPMSAPPSPCTRRRTATAAWATSSPGMPAPARSCWSKPEKFSVWSGALVTAGDVVFYGTLEGYMKASTPTTRQGTLEVQDAVGDHRQRHTWEYKGKQYVGVLSGIGGWAGIGMAAGLTKDTEGLGAVGGYKDLAK